VLKGRIHTLAWIFAAFVALAFVEYWVGLLSPLEHRLSDLFIRIHARYVAADPDIVIVDIDDRSLTKMAELADRWPWPRSVHGELAAGLAKQKPKAIVFDLMFVEPDRTRPESDELFNQLIAPIGNAYFPTTRLDKKAMPMACCCAKWRSLWVCCSGATHSPRPAPICRFRSCCGNRMRGWASSTRCPITMACSIAKG
jgi:hypothetical protein